MRLLTAICLAALVVAFAVPAFAETQNIKISGDIGVSQIYQNNIDLHHNDKDDQNQFIQQVGLNVEADLTDNVSTYVRLIEERAWNAEQGVGGTSAQFDVKVDEAYLTLEEMLYAPLTLKIGRQNIWLGKGLIIGNAGVLVWDEGGLPMTVRQFSDMTAFDAIRATLDYDPWTIDLIYSKIDANVNAAGGFNHDDVNLYVANIGYDFTKYDAEAEAYLVIEHDREAIITTTPPDREMIYTMGLRGSFIPFDNANVWAEGALQYGDYRQGEKSCDREAAAANIGADYTFVDVRWTPKVGAEILWLSGEDADQSGKWNAWNPVYRGRFDTTISDFRNITMATNIGQQTAGSDTGVTNQLQASAIFALEPMTDISLDSRWSLMWYDEVPMAGRNDEIGHELDAKLTYDYTEDVQFTCAGGMFFPLEYWVDTADSTAGQLVTAVKVDF